MTQGSLLASDHAQVLANDYIPPGQFEHAIRILHADWRVSLLGSVPRTFGTFLQMPAADVSGYDQGRQQQTQQSPAGRTAAGVLETAATSATQASIRPTPTKVAMRARRASSTLLVNSTLRML